LIFQSWFVTFFDGGMTKGRQTEIFVGGSCVIYISARVLLSGLQVGELENRIIILVRCVHLKAIFWGVHLLDVLGVVLLALAHLPLLDQLLVIAIFSIDGLSHVFGTCA